MAKHRADTGTLEALAVTAIKAAPTAGRAAALATAVTLVPVGAAHAYTVNDDGTVTVQRGDTVSEIAYGEGKSTRATLAANGLDADDLIFPGDRLTLAGMRKAAPSVAAPEAAPSTAQADLAADGSAIVAAARAQIGVPYVYGGDGLAEGGFDCSGLTKYAARAAGITLPRTSTEQKRVGYPVSNPQPGDLVTFDGITHVAIYVGNGRIIDAPKPGRTVQERDLWTSNVTYRRIT